MSGRELTGRKVFLIIASAFGVVIGVNVILAVQAIRTFPGLETKNSYVASQSFDVERSAQLALGWDVVGEVTENELRLHIVDRDGVSVEVADLKSTLGRATHVADDMTPEFTLRDGTYVWPVDLAPGNWNLRVLAVAENGTEFRQRIPIYIRQTK